MWCLYNEILYSDENKWMAYNNTDECNKYNATRKKHIPKE